MTPLVTEETLIAGLLRQIIDLQRERVIIFAALRFYADKQHWGGLPLLDTEFRSDVLQIKNGSGWDAAVAALREIS
jgi:hypothetical protein